MEIHDKVLVAKTKDDLRNNNFDTEMIIVGEDGEHVWKLRHESWAEGVTVGMPKNYCKEIKDLFETPELIPADVQAVLDTFDENADGYAEMRRLVKELEPLGYTFDYYLDAEPYLLRKISK